MAAATGVGIWLHITGSDILYQFCQDTEHIFFQHFQLISVCQIAGQRAILFDFITHALRLLPRFHSLQHCLILQKQSLALPLG